MKYFKIILVLSISLLLNSCGIYNMTGTQPINAKTFQVNYFQNNAPLVEPGIERTFTLKLQDIIQNQTNRNNNTSNNVNAIQNSLLSSGNWYRFYVEKSGVYRISKTFLQSLGMNVNVDPRNIKIYGNGGRMLPLNNTLPYPEDLLFPTSPWV